jgi:hypothetical protein
VRFENQLPGGHWLESGVTFAGTSAVPASAGTPEFREGDCSWL